MKHEVDIARYVWSTREALALHYGFRDERARTHAEALSNEDRVLAEIAGITAGDHVLDAGCGIGGSAIWIAENIGARVTGISISHRHVRLATQNAQKRHVAGRVDFKVADYNCTGFADATFDVVWACESISHAGARIAGVLQELRRVLKPGGRLVVADGFQFRNAANPREQRLHDAFVQTIGADRTLSWDSFDQVLRKTDYADIRRWNVTPLVRPQALRMRRLVQLMSPGAALLEVLRVILPANDSLKSVLDVWRTTRDQWNCLESGIWIYGIYCAQKMGMGI
jgi:SAM-dependent methyltransferase